MKTASSGRFWTLLYPSSLSMAGAKMPWHSVSCYLSHLSWLCVTLWYVDLGIGAESIGYPGIAHGLFPKGGVELAYHFIQQSNAQLAVDLEKQVQLGR